MFLITNCKFCSEKSPLSIKRVMSEWKSADDWIEGMTREELQGIQCKIDSLIGEKTFFDVYRVEEF